MKTKLKLRLGLLLYCTVLVFVPEISIYALCLNGVSVIIALAANVSFILFLRSRKPAEKTIINRLLLTNFYVKMMFCLLYYSLSCVGYSSQTHKNDLEKVFSNTMLSYISVKTASNLGFLIYILISLARTLLFISPGTFRSLNATVVHWVAMTVLLAYFVADLIFFQVVFSANKCEVDQNGIGIHTFALEIFLKTREQISEGMTKGCYVAPTTLPLSVILLAIESVRVVAATARELKKSRRQKTRVVPDIPVVRARYTVKKTIRSNSVSSENPIKIVEARRLSLQFVPKEKVEDLEMNNMELDIKLKETSSTRLVVDFISNLMKRTYSLVVFLFALASLCFMLPISFLGLDRLQIMFKIGKLDVFFVPVFWLLIDKDVWQFTKKNLSKRILGVKMRLSN